MIKTRDIKEDKKILNESEFLKNVHTYFWMEAKDIQLILKILKWANNNTEELILTEQFNLWFIEWMKETTMKLEEFFKDYVKQPIQDFREICPNWNVEDIVIEDIVITDNIIDSKWNQ
jgi:hypothetical protein